MTCKMKLSLMRAIVLLLAAAGPAGCSGSSASTSGLGGGVDSGSTSSSGGDSGGTTPKGDGGTGPTGDGGTGSCTIASDWSNNSAGPACDTCEQQHCCAVIQACNDDKGCKAIYDCQNNCYTGIGLDGGPIPQDGGAVDDAGDTAEDLCAQTCIDQAPSASQSLFTPQDDCVNGSGANQCGGASVCN
jgi:hypothetical protein